MAILTEDLSTFDGLADRKIIDMADTIYMLRPSAAPLTVITGRTSRRPCTQREFNWLEEGEAAISTQIDQTGGYGTGDTAWVVDANTAEVFKPGDLLYVARTGEVARVTAVNTATSTLTVTRAWGASTAAAINDDDYLYNIGNAVEENSQLPEQRLDVESKVSNYTQIFRQPFGVSRSEKAIAEYGGDRLTHLRLTQGIKFRRKLEWALLFGTKAQTLVGGKYVQSTEGIFARVTTNSIDLGATVTYGGFEQALESAFTYGSDTKVFAVGRRLYTLLNQVAGNRLEITSPSERTFGLRITTWHGAHGDVQMVTHPMLVNDFATYGVLLDMGELSVRYLAGNGENRDTKLETGKESPGQDGYIEEYIAELGFQIRQEKKHAIIYCDSNATAAKDSGF